MARICSVTGKRPRVGNRVSHAHNKTKRRFLPNLQSRRFWSEEQQRFIRVRVSNAGLRLIDKLGFDEVMKTHLNSKKSSQLKDSSTCVTKSN